MKFSNILLVEGKPGIGKSHYVNQLIKTFKNNLVYRFWISNQDKFYKSRLVYKNLLNDFSKNLFNDYVSRNETDIIKKIKSLNKIVIIDGLDHVENYNQEDLKKIVNFINKIKKENKIIILSRPLKYKLNWKKQTLTNWNKKDTHKVLNELYHINEYSICEDIYEITDGYPILVRFISEHYKIYNKIPQLDKLIDIDDYYDKVIINLNTKSALSIFLVSQSFYMKSELDIFLEDEFLSYVNEFIKGYPYLFEIRLNRISLLHDSFNKYLLKQKINISTRRKKVNEIIYKSIINLEFKFLSRFSYFELDNEMKLNIIRKYSSIELFNDLVVKIIDFESIRSFYFQLRETLSDMNSDNLEIIQYYDLSLILNIVGRDHTSSINTFLYTYVNSLMYNGFSEKDITSSEYLFGMFCYIKENDSTILYNVTSNDYFDTRRFTETLEQEIYSEDSFFKMYDKPIKLKNKIEFYFKDEYRNKEDVTNILVNLYIHNTDNKELFELQNCIKTFIDINVENGIFILDKIITQYNWKSYRARWILNDVKKILLSLGLIFSNNDYLNLSLKEYIKKNSYLGSFDMWVNILNYMRLSLHQSRKIDITSIGNYFAMYHKRKDYSVINIDNALTVFEEKGLTTEKESIKKIVFIQSMSEKGIYHLLTEYINLHEPNIIKTILNGFELEYLEVNWFQLSSMHISSFSNKLFNFA